MNLIVVARRPEAAEKCAATVQALTGRHPSRTVVIQSADPDGPSWLDARIEAHCVMPREDAPETCAETIFVTCRRGGRPAPVGHRDAADHPRPAGHGLVAGRAAADQPGRPRPAGRRGSPRRRRLDLERRRPGPARRDGGHRGHLAPRDQRLRAGPPVALARGDRLDLRRPGLPAVPAVAAPDRGDLRDARRDRRARIDQPRQAGLPRRLAGFAARAVGGPAAGGRDRGRGAARRCRAPGACRGRQADGRSRPGRDAVGRPGRGRGRRPAGRLDDARRDDAAGRAARRATRVGAAGRRDRGGRDRPRPRLAGRRRGARPAFPGAAPDGLDLLAEAVESGGRDSVSVGALRSAAELVRPIGGPP